MRTLVSIFLPTHRRILTPTFAFLFLCLSCHAARGDDLVEFLNGAKARGAVKAIRKAEREFDVEVKIGARTVVRTYSFAKVHAVTMRGKRYVLNEIAPVSQEGVKRVERTRAEVVELINSVGRTPPEWLADTPLNAPKSLDLSWPNAPKKVWDNRRFPGHYVWDVINPNPSRWREGVKLMHHLVAANENNRVAQVKAMNQLGTLYASLLEDWPRAAYWWRQAGKGTSGAMGIGGFRVGYEVGLARCYWKLGNKPMALELLNGKGTPAIWCEMGEHDRALRQAEQARKGWMKEQALIVCGDVCRHAGWYDKALDYYQRATRLPMTDKYKRTIPEAKERIAAMRAEQAVDLTKARNGTYRGRSLGYSGMIDVAVAVRNQRITSVKVTRHTEKQYYSSLTDIPTQIVERQSVRGIDATSSATITAEAIVRASAMALESAN
ncbi:MAG: FMN-binding protein [Pirellulaceae bacterium]|jgi:uncharacterized protein with FMN-binding domain|nr:FMN-binding protein [Pirellulaceae bacterium]MDP7019941.1 FMN-binding protein [Pirellulaceae bacterium]